MQTPVDHFIKQLLDLALSWTGTPVADAVVPASDDQRADVLYVPDPALVSRRGDFGLFGRIAAEPRHFEHFTATPDYEAFVECVRKRLNLQHDEALRAAREERPVRTYTLWVLCAGDPVTLRATLRLRRAKAEVDGMLAKLREEVQGILEDLLRAGVLEAGADATSSAPPDSTKAPELIPLPPPPAKATGAVAASSSSPPCVRSGSPKPVPPRS